MSVKIKKNGEFSDSGEYKNQINSHNSCNLYSSDPLKLLKLVESLSQSDTSNSVKLQIQFNKYLQAETESSYAFLVPVFCNSEEGLLQVIGEQILDNEYRFSVTHSELRKLSLLNGSELTLSHLNKEFDDFLEKVVGYKHNTLIFKINLNTLDINDEIPNISLFCCIAGDQCMKENVEHCVREAFKYTFGHITASFELQEEKRVRGQCQHLLRVARRLLGKIGDIGQLLRGVMAEAKDIAGAERCSLFLLDKYSGELVSKVFDGNETTKEIRIKFGQGIAGLVASTGKLLNIKNAYEHPLFYKGIDELTGFRTKSILCFPICDERGVIGVAQMCNKVNGFHFDKCDEEIATAFSVYCGISIIHSLVHNEVQKAEARNKLSQELLLYHMKVPENEVVNLLKETAIESALPTFSSFTFCPRGIEYSNSMRMSMKMFKDLNFISKFKIPEEKLARFLLLVQKGYRDTPYHNWDHAFSVAHFAYTLLINLKLIENGIITDLQGFTFLIACFCHDLDHRGTNNSYQMHSKSPLARLYSSQGSVNERHHLSQAICILNEQNSKILDGLNNHEFKESIDYLRELILATDLAQHFRIFNDIKNLRKENIHENRRLLLSLLITCSDLNDQIKPWPTTQNVADLVYCEFFHQGDLEKQMGIAPNEMMDRQKACIPELQIEFITTVVSPTFELLTKIFPETSELLIVVDNNRKQWEDLNLSEEN